MISACMAISVRELRTAVREWACCLILAWFHTFVEINREIISTDIEPSSLRLIQERLSATSESMCANYWLTP